MNTTSIRVRILALLFLLTCPGVQVLAFAFAFAFQPSASIHTSRTTTRKTTRSTDTRATTAIQMGLFDFFKTRENDFIKLDESQDTFGPGPLVLLYNIPNGIEDEEIDAMLQDGAPVAYRKGNKKGSGGIGGIAFQRIYPQDFQEESIIDSEKTVSQVLEQALLAVKTGGADIDVDTDANTDAGTYIDTHPNANTNTNDNTNDNTNANERKPKPSIAHVPILYFSGISNQEMMQCYNIIAREIYTETQGMANPACAKVVQPALNKSFRLLLEEISGDHADAMRMAEEVGTGDSNGDGEE